MRWNKLYAATAGMATKRPTAVATSASEMCACSVAETLAAFVAAAPPGEAPAAAASRASSSNARDDADDRAEKSDERRVVADRAEEREPALQTRTLKRARAGHRLFGGVRAARRFDQTRDHDRGLGARRGLETASRAFAIARAQERREIAHQLGDVVAQRDEQPPTLEHDGDRNHAQHEHEDEHPTGAQTDQRTFDSFQHS